MAWFRFTEQIVIPALVIALLVGGIAGILLGCALVFRSAATLNFIARMNRWISTGQALKPLDEPRDIEPGPRAYVAFLEELEDGLYDAEDRLREDVLIERVRRDPRWAFQAGNRAVETVGVSPLELPLAGKRNITCLPPNLGGA